MSMNGDRSRKSSFKYAESEASFMSIIDFIGAYLNISFIL